MQLLKHERKYRVFLTHTNIRTAAIVGASTISLTHKVGFEPVFPEFGDEQFRPLRHLITFFLLSCLRHFNV